MWPKCCARVRQCKKMGSQCNKWEEIRSFLDWWINHSICSLLKQPHGQDPRIGCRFRMVEVGEERCDVTPVRRVWSPWRFMEFYRKSTATWSRPTKYKQYADERHLPRQREKHYAVERHLPCQREKHYADERHLPWYADDRYLPRQREEHYADEWHLPESNNGRLCW